MKKITLLLMVLLSLSGYSQFEEGFEGSNPPAPDWDLGTTGWGSDGHWAIFDNGVGTNQSWSINSGVATPPLVCDGSQSAYMNRENIGDGNTSRDFLATPKITLPSNAQLRFFTRTTLNGNQGTIYKIMWAPGTANQNDPAAYTLVQQFTEDQLNATFNICEEKVVSLAAHAGQQGYVAFVMEYTQVGAGLSGDRWLVDKVRILEQCLDPGPLAANTITQTSANLTWPNPSGATQWEIEIIPFTATATGSGDIITNNPYTATHTTGPSPQAFTPTTQYKYYVRALCDNGAPSLWVGPFAFTTSSPGLTCDSPIVIGSTPYSTTDDTGNYGDSTDDPQPAACAGTATNFMTGNDVFYSYTPTESGAISITMTPTGNWSGIFVYDGCANVGNTCVAGVANGDTSVRDIPSLAVEAGHTYIIVISTNAFPQTVGYDMIIQTLNCAPPTGLTATGTGPTTANLSWQNPGGATSWEVYVQIAGSPIPTDSGTTTSINTNYPATELTGIGAPLSLDNSYQYWVRADCGDGTFSPWAGPYLFNTSNCSSGCNYSFVMTDQFGGWEGNTMTIMQGPLTIATIGSTFTSGTGPITISVPLCDGPFDLVWNSGGDFANEVGISIVNSFGQTIFTHESGNDQSGTTLFSGVVDCANPQCLPPTNLSVSNITTHEATLSWTPNGTIPPASWEIYAVPAGDPAPTDASVPTATTTTFPYTITGLLADTEYVYYVRAVCSSPGANPWSGASDIFLTLPTCPKPTALVMSAIDQTTATVSWTAGGAETAWEVIILPAGSAPPTATDPGWVASPNATPTFDLTGLISGTSYDVYVRAVCSPTDSSTPSAPVTFHTSICPAANQCLYSFTMVDQFGDGWNGNTIDVIQNGIVVATLTGPDFTDGQNPVTIQIPLCHGIPFELFWNEGGFFTNEVGLTVTSFLGEAIYTHSPGTGLEGTTIYQGTGECIPPTCLKPTNVIVSGITLDSAIVQWTENNTPPVGTWEIIVLPATAPAPLPGPVAGAITVTTNPYTLSGLDPATNYKVYVRAVCSDTDSSFWSLGVQFNTVVCLPSNLCDYTFVMVDAFGDGWNGNTMNVTQNGILMGTLTGPDFTAGQDPVSQTIALCNGVPVELFWNNGGAFANEVGVSIVNASEDVIFEHAPGDNLQGTEIYSGTVSCVPPTCPKPVQLLATDVTETTATLSWTEAATATAWEILILPAGSPPPTDTTVGIPATNPYFATDLISGTSYVFYVRAICSDTDHSHWSGPKPFATLITNDECNTATIVQVNPDQSCTQTASGTLVGATPSNVPTTCGGTPDDDVWFSFVATSTAVSIDLNNITGSTEDLFHVLYEGTCGSLNEIYCSDDNQSIATGLIPGNTYYIRVYSWTSDPGQTSSFNVCIGTIPPPITTNTTQYTVEQLVTDVLLSSTCATVGNITYSTGTNFGSTNGIGYFEKNGSSFPFNNGIVLTTGSAESAPGPNTTGLSDGDFGWPGDPDLQAIVAAQGQFNDLHNATILEFDFTPLINTMSFNFLFASEEYGTFQCNFSDVFAFLLTDVAAGTTTNLAVLPSTTTPISVTTIRNDLYNAGCPSANPEYFDTFYQLPDGTSPLADPINYNGNTVPLTASSDVIPGHLYHIKLAIADYSDTAFDSAVFLQGGSFGIGNINLGDNLLQSTGNAICSGGSTVLSTPLDPSVYNFQWFENDNPIPGATGPSLTVTEPGTYTIHVNFTGTTCTGSDDIIVEFYDPIAPGTPNDLNICDASGVGVFDLTQNDAVILAPLGAGYTVSYYTSCTDATAGANAILNPAAYTNVTNPQTICTRVQNDVTGCFSVVQFNISVQDLTPQFTLPSKFTICSGTSQTIAVTPLNFDLADATYSWTLDGNPLPDVTSSITVTAAGLYEVTVNRSGCTSTLGVSVEVTPTPTADVLNDVIVCSSDGYVLPALSANNSYYNGPGGTGGQIVLPATITTGQTVYIYAQSGTCTAESSFIVTVNQTPNLTAIANVSQCGSYTLPSPQAGSHYYTATGGPGGAGTQLSDNEVINTAGTQTIYEYAETGTVPNCLAEVSFTVTITESPVVDVLADVSQCDSYTLPVLAVGNYFTATGGGGTPHFAGESITTSVLPMYIYAASGTCSDESSFNINIGTTPAFTIDSGCQGASYVLSVVPSNGFDAQGASYSWSSASGGSITGTGQSVTVSGADSYTVAVLSGGCSHSETVSVDNTGCLIQKGISPNGDGLNDYFDLVGQNVTKLEIFNRYGTVVYKKNNYSNQWYGQSDKGDELPDGTYYYVIDRATGESKTGWIYINRERN